MNIELARDVIRAAFQSTSELGKLLPTLKEQCNPAEYRTYALGIAAAIDAIMTNTINRAVQTYPDLAKEIDEQIAKHGRYQ
jgi:hypothetical protein